MGQVRKPNADWWRVYLEGDRQSGGAMQEWSKHKTVDAASKVAASVSRKNPNKQVLLYDPDGEHQGTWLYLPAVKGVY